MQVNGRLAGSQLERLAPRHPPDNGKITVRSVRGAGVRSINDLKKFTRDAAALVAREKDLASYEVYCSTGEHKVVRLNYTSDIPSRGIEEFKSLDADGFALRIVTRRDPHETGSA